VDGILFVGVGEARERCRREMAEAGLPPEAFEDLSVLLLEGEESAGPAPAPRQTEPGGID